MNKSQVIAALVDCLIHATRMREYWQGTIAMEHYFDGKIASYNNSICWVTLME